MVKGIALGKGFWKVDTLLWRAKVLFNTKFKNNTKLKKIILS